MQTLQTARKSPFNKSVFSFKIGIEIKNSIVIFDEAHNVEKVCEESASLEIRSTDLTLCIDEITQVMKAMADRPPWFDEQHCDFEAEELCNLKQMMLDLERVVDGIEIKNNNGSYPEGTNYGGDHIYEILKKAQVNTLYLFHY